MSDPWLAALFAGLAALTPVVVAAVVLLITTVGKNRRARDKSAIAQWREVADHQQRQLEALQAHVAELSEGYEELSDERVRCQVDLADLYGATALLHDFSRRCAACCRKLGDDPGELPPLPPRPPRPDRAAAEFRKRTLQHNTQLLSGVRPPPPLPPVTPPEGGQP